VASENSSRNDISNPNAGIISPVQFGVNFGDVTAFSNAQLQTAIDIANKHYIQLIRVYDQFHNQQNWNDFMDLVQKNSIPPINGLPIKIIVGVSNDDLHNSFNSASNANDFITNYIFKYKDNIQAILLGNELNTKYANLIPNIPRYAKNLKAALNSRQITNIDIGLSIGGHQTDTSPGDLTGWCAVNKNLTDAINMANQTTVTITKLFLNDYPYFDPKNQLKNNEIYGNFMGCFDSFRDSIKTNVAATYKQITLAVGETGWPSNGTTSGSQIPSVAMTNSNLNCIMAGVYQNTAAGNQPAQVFFFEFFDETKSQDKNHPENYFGLFENLVDKNNAPKDKRYDPKLGITLNFKDPSQAQCL